MMKWLCFLSLLVFDSLLINAQVPGFGGCPDFESYQDFDMNKVITLYLYLNFFLLNIYLCTNTHDATHIIIIIFHRYRHNRYWILNLQCVVSRMITFYLHFDYSASFGTPIGLCH